MHALYHAMMRYYCRLPAMLQLIIPGRSIVPRLLVRSVGEFPFARDLYQP